MFVIAILFSLAHPLSLGLKRHGEDVGEVPLAISHDELVTIVDNSITTISSGYPSLVKELMDILEDIKETNNTSSIVFYSNIIYGYLNNTTIPWMSRIDYIALSIIASIEGSYNDVAVIDPVRLITLLKKYEQARIRWLIEEIGKEYPILAEYISKYNLAENESSKELILGKIRKILLELADNGRIDILLLASEALNTTIPLGFTIDRIKLAEYLNNTADSLKKYNASGIARTIRLLKTISRDLYYGKISTAWQYFSILKKEVLKLNITLDFEDAVKLSALLSITGITINGAHVNTGILKTNSAIIADILTSLSYDIRLKTLNILANASVKKNENPGKVEIPYQSFRILTNILATNSSGTSLGILVLRQPVKIKSAQQGIAVNVMSNPVVFVAVVSISIIVAAIIIHTTIQLPVPDKSSSASNYFSETPLRSDQYSRMIINYYMKAIRLLSSKGYPRFYWETPREHLLKVKDSGCYEYFSRIVELYERTIFADEPAAVERAFLEKLLRRLEECT